jgi:hypothetical protein
MTDALRVVLEIGWKGRRVVAGAIDWPCLDRDLSTLSLLMGARLMPEPRHGWVPPSGGDCGRASILTNDPNPAYQMLSFVAVRIGFSMTPVGLGTGECLPSESSLTRAGMRR